ncbi:E3 ubiquitin-protein ligase ORTHRUS 2, partial [Striga hermonthica]
ANVSEGIPKVYPFIRNQDRPHNAFTTERARKAGHAVGRYLSQFLLIILVQLQWRMTQKESWESWLGKHLKIGWNAGKQWGATFLMLLESVVRQIMMLSQLLCLEVMKMTRIMGTGSSTLE